VVGATSLRAIAAGLNERRIPTAKGGQWSAVQVARIWSGRRIDMNTDLVAQLARAGELIAAAPTPGIADEVNKHLNQLLGWPFQAASGTAFDRDGLATAPFGSLIFSRVQEAEKPDGHAVNIDADTLACAVDVTHTLDSSATSIYPGSAGEGSEEIAGRTGRDAHDHYVRRNFRSCCNCAA
jgi:hypothetical protein